TSFVNNGRANGLNVGLQFFPLAGVAPASCTAPYATPEVELGLLPANAAALTASIQKHSPTALTPTAPALQGAINHMKAWAPGHPGRAPVVVFVTDGFPTECDPQQIPDIAALAKTAYETDPKVRTFVVGFNLGQAGQNLNQLAKAGGTNKAFLIDKGDIGAAFVNAMLSIANQPLSCALDIPKPMVPGMTLDPTLVDVRYTPSATGVTEHVQKLNNLGECDAAIGGQGWYYDSPAMPTKILVCPGTCAGFAAGVVETINGCSPNSQIPK
ncbi:MAG TPA: vWA domain-containing protein, partial [Polyangiaceae bacterium]